ncbi:MAG: hypothetical protein AAB849_00575 [Patescibacteria group bacterium]
MDGSLKKIISLIKKTGDRLIVLETDNPEPYVVMGLADYEKLIEGKMSWEKQEPLPLSESLPNFDDLADSELSDFSADSKADDVFGEEEIKEKPVAEEREDQYYFEPLEP